MKINQLIVKLTLNILVNSNINVIFARLHKKLSYDKIKRRRFRPVNLKLIINKHPMGKVSKRPWYMVYKREIKLAARTAISIIKTIFL